MYTIDRKLKLSKYLSANWSKSLSKTNERVWNVSRRFWY